jgi:serine/threonine protein kinase
MAYCLNQNVRHLNPDYALRCKECDFFVKGAQIDSYEITGLLGKGSFGDVYEVCEPPPLGRSFALKVLRSELSQDSDSKKFSDEATKIAKLQHQNILPVYKFGRLENNRPYFIMEHATGTLKGYFRKPDGSSQLAFAEGLVPFVEQIARALDYIHQNGYIHQDVKPINLLMKGEHVYLADFGTSYYLLRHR